MDVLGQPVGTTSNGHTRLPFLHCLHKRVDAVDPRSRLHEWCAGTRWSRSGSSPVFGREAWRAFLGLVGREAWRAFLGHFWGHFVGQLLGRLWGRADVAILALSLVVPVAIVAGAGSSILVALGHFWDGFLLLANTNRGVDGGEIGRIKSRAASPNPRGVDRPFWEQANVREEGKTTLEQMARTKTRVVEKW
jgi:hypothetical protein